MYTSKNKKILDLQAQVNSLQKELAKEAAAHSEDLAALNDLRANREMEERSFRELIGSCRQKLADIDAQSAKMQEREKKQKLMLEAEAAKARVALDKEIESERRRAREALLFRIRSFSDNYNYYLSQLKLMMDMLTKAATKTGEVFLSPDAGDTKKLFHREMSPQSEGMPESGCGDTPGAQAAEETSEQAEGDDRD